MDPARHRLDELVAIGERRDAHRDLRNSQQIGIERLRGTSIGDEVEAEAAVEALGAFARDEPVVAAFAHVAVIAPAAIEHVVPVGVEWVVLERSEHVADHLVGLGATVNPVVADLAQQHVGGGATLEEVVSGAGENFAEIGAQDDEVVIDAAHEEVDAWSTVNGVVARAALEDVISE